MPCEQSYYHGIAPDYPVASSPETLAAGKDAVLDYTLELIAERDKAAH
jgi:hypothetical protein